jgi:hypothetical protein
VGFEPTLDSATTDDFHCDCKKCWSARAALALNCRSADCPSPALLDIDLQRVVAAWGTLPEAIRRAMMTMIEIAGFG